MRSVFPIILLLFLLFFLGSRFIFAKSKLVDLLDSTINTPIAFLNGAWYSFGNIEVIDALKKENDSLKAELWLFKKDISGKKEKGLLLAKVFANYPFNDKSLIYVNLGSKDGVKKGMLATVGSSIFLGEVTDVSENLSTIKTIFSRDSQFAVRIGDKEVEALLSGGPSLDLKMLTKNNDLKERDTIFLATKGLPYGMKLGVLRLGESGRGTSVYESASLEVSYDLSELSEVWLHQ